MTGLPEPKWLDLSAAYTQSLAAFPDEEPIDVDVALIAAFADGAIRARGRCESYREHNGLNEIEAHLWSSAGFVPHWEMNRLGIPRDTGWYIFTDVEVDRIDLVEWLAGKPVSNGPTWCDISVERAPDTYKSSTLMPFDIDRAARLLIAEKLSGGFDPKCPPTQDKAKKFLKKQEIFSEFPSDKLRSAIHKAFGKSPPGRRKVRKTAN